MTKIESMYRSKDLREAAVRYRMEGHTLIETAKVFGVGKTSGSCTRRIDNRI